MEPTGVAPTSPSQHRWAEWQVGPATNRSAAAIKKPPTIVGGVLPAQEIPAIQRIVTSGRIRRWAHNRNHSDGRSNGACSSA